MIYVVDGDTFDVLIDGVEERVGYIGIDTPELGGCYYGESSAANEQLVSGQEVWVVSDPANDRDSTASHRLLRYVWAGDVFVNELLVREGFAEATTRFPERRFEEALVDAEREAHAAGRGIWTACPSFGELS